MPPRRKPQTSLPAAVDNLHPAAHLQAFLRYQEAECGMSPNTVSAYRNDIRQFLEFLSTTRFQSVLDVNLACLADYLHWLHKQVLKPTTISRRLVALKMFFRYLVLEGVIGDSQVDLLSSPKLWQYLPTVLSPEKVDELLAAPAWEDAFPLRDKALLTVLYATGCRASEVSGLKKADLRLEENYCRCLGKGNKERIVNLNPVARDALVAYLEKERPKLLRDADEQALFLTRSGKRLGRIAIWHLVKKYAERVSCGESISPHTLRHSFATHMLAGGAEIRALQEMLGHASIRTTQIYTQVEHSRLKAIHAKCHPRG